jgi:hypothetical protein
MRKKESELNLALEKYFNEDENIIHFFGKQKKVILNFMERLFKVYLFEEPDGFYKEENNVLIVEHFEFDSTKRSKGKGSEYRREEAKINRKISNLVPNEKGKIYHEKFECTHTIVNYINNAMNLWREHYKNIINYKERLKKENIIKKGDIIETAFLIEDMTCLGNSYMENDKLYSLILLHCEEFLNLFETCIDVKYILSLSTNGNYKNIWFIDRSFIKDYRKYQIKKGNIKIIDFKPNIVGWEVIIPNGKINKKENNFIKDTSSKEAEE